MARLLIVSPGFHGYYASIRRAFEALGHDVETYCYDAASSSLERVWRKARHELPGRLRGSGTHLSPELVSQRAATRVREAGPDIVLVIRGDVLTEEFWHAAATTANHVAVWMYDEMRRTAFDPHLVGRYASMATYSALDTQALIDQGFDALHVPLGFDDTAPMARSAAGRGVVSFIGAPFVRRADALHALMSAGIPVQAWGRGWSDHPYDRARTWRLKSAGVPSGRDVPGPEAHAIMRNSIGTLNIHGDQDGFTMRTFEAAGVGAVQFIDRADVEEYYVPGTEVLVFEDHDHLIELARDVLQRPATYVGLRERAREHTLAEHTLRHRAMALEGLWA